jgi:hypothetical protein
LHDIIVELTVVNIVAPTFIKLSSTTQGSSFERHFFNLAVSAVEIQT